MTFRKVKKFYDRVESEVDEIIFDGAPKKLLEFRTNLLLDYTVDCAILEMVLENCK
jgi:hypothetical protein